MNRENPTAYLYFYTFNFHRRPDVVSKKKLTSEKKFSKKKKKQFKCNRLKKIFKFNKMKSTIE